MTKGAPIGVTGNAAERGAILGERRCYDMACDSAARGLDGLPGNLQTDCKTNLNGG
jgi:hypothetical protein